MDSEAQGISCYIIIKGKNAKETAEIIKKIAEECGGKVEYIHDTDVSYMPPIKLKFDDLTEFGKEFLVGCKYEKTKICFENQSK
jgi:hypothetical protein